MAFGRRYRGVRGPRQSPGVGADGGRTLPDAAVAWPRGGSAAPSRTRSGGCGDVLVAERAARIRVTCRPFEPPWPLPTLVIRRCGPVGRPGETEARHRSARFERSARQVAGALRASGADRLGVGPLAIVEPEGPRVGGRAVTADDPQVGTMTGGQRHGVGLLFFGLDRLYLEFVLRRGKAVYDEYVLNPKNRHGPPQRPGRGPACLKSGC